MRVQRTQADRARRSLPSRVRCVAVSVRRMPPPLSLYVLSCLLLHTIDKHALVHTTHALIWLKRQGYAAAASLHATVYTYPFLLLSHAHSQAAKADAASAKPHYERTFFPSLLHDFVTLLNQPQRTYSPSPVYIHIHIHIQIFFFAFCLFILLPILFSRTILFDIYIYFLISFFLLSFSRRAECAVL